MIEKTNYNIMKVIDKYRVLEDGYRLGCEELLLENIIEDILNRQELTIKKLQNKNKSHKHWMFDETELIKLVAYVDKKNVLNKKKGKKQNDSKSMDRRIRNGIS